MDKNELIEQLSAAEHASWAGWMSYLFEKCHIQEDGDGYEHYVIPYGSALRWKRQIKTPYADLSEQEKQSDRDEVAHILPIIEAYNEELLKDALSLLMEYDDELGRMIRRDPTYANYIRQKELLALAERHSALIEKVKEGENE